jgi:hypothetical protein
MHSKKHISRKQKIVPNFVKVLQKRILKEFKNLQGYSQEFPTEGQGKYKPNIPPDHRIPPYACLKYRNPQSLNSFSGTSGDDGVIFHSFDGPFFKL